MPDTSTTSGLKRGALGTGSVVFIVISAAAPLLVMAGVMPTVLLVGGVGAPSAYLFAGATLAIFAVGFTTMSRHVSHTGGFYGYIAQGLGNGPGVVAAVVALFSYSVIEIGLFGLLGLVAEETFLGVFGIDLPWPIWALAGLALITFLAFRSVSVGARVLAVLLTAEVGILLALAFAVVLRGGADGIGFDSFHPSTTLTTAMGTVLPIAFAAFIGFESTVIYRAEAKDPNRTIPGATYIAVAFLAVLYAFIVWSVVLAYGADNVVAAAAGDRIGLVFAAVDTYLGGWAVTLMRLLIVTSVVASLLAFHNAFARYARVIALKGLIPKRLAAVHPSTRSPHIAVLVQSALAAAVVAGFAIAGADPYTQLLIWLNSPGVLGILLLQVAVAVSVVVYFRRTSHREGRWRTIIAPLLASAGLLVGVSLAVINPELITGASTLVNMILIWTIVVVALLAGAWALWLRANRRDIYQNVGADVLD